MIPESVIRNVKDNVSIIDVATNIGFHLVRTGGYYSLQEHDSVRIDDNKNIFTQNSNNGPHPKGSVIDFVMNFTNMDFIEAVNYLKDLGNIKSDDYTPKKREATKVKKEEVKEIVLPNKNTTYKHVFAYLTKTRGINREIVQKFVDEDMLYQDEKNNCVFVAYDDTNNPTYASLRGTYLNKDGKRFVSELKGCNYNEGFYIKGTDSKIIPKTLYVFEGVIDMMSMMTMKHEDGVHINLKNWLAMGGTGKADCILTHIEKDRPETVYLCLDNDAAGLKAMKEISERIKSLYPSITIRISPPRDYNDWNDYLVSKREEAYINKMAKMIVDMPSMNIETEVDKSYGYQKRTEEILKKIGNRVLEIKEKTKEEIDLRKENINR